MRRLVIVLAVASAMTLIAGTAMAAKPTSFDSQGNGKDFVTDGGFDEWGYNYRAHLFSGDYCDAYEGAEWCQPYVGVDLIMKWNEAWLSSSDLDGDGELDRHYGSDGYVGSGAWITNHMSGDYQLDGQPCSWTYFVKIVAVPADAYLVGGVWMTVDGTEIGESIWNEFAIIQSVYNDPCGGDAGVEYVSPNGAGLGRY